LHLQQIHSIPFDEWSLLMNKREGVRRIAVVLKVMGWIALGICGLLIGYAALSGHMSSLGDGVILLALFGGLALGGAYVLSGFAGSQEKEP
jgi:hypothetical protein